MMCGMKAKRIEDWHIYQTAEDLPEEYRNCVHPVSEDNPFSVFQHPFLVQLMPVCLPVPIGEAIAHFEGMADKRLDQDGFAAYLGFVERPFRASLMCDIIETGEWPGTGDNDADWGLVADIWRDCEAQEDNPVWGRMVDLDLPGGPHLMTAPENRKEAGQLIGSTALQVYCGVQASSQRAAETAYGHSWTLSAVTAAWFAERNVGEGQSAFVLTASIPSDIAVAYLPERGESEIIIRPQDMRAEGDITSQKVRP